MSSPAVGLLLAKGLAETFLAIVLAVLVKGPKVLDIVVKSEDNYGLCVGGGGSRCWSSRVEIYNSLAGALINWRKALFKRSTFSKSSCLDVLNTRQVVSSVTRRVSIDLPSLEVLYLVTYRTLSGLDRVKARAEVAKVIKSSCFIEVQSRSGVGWWLVFLN